MSITPSGQRRSSTDGVEFLRTFNTLGHETVTLRLSVDILGLDDHALICMTITSGVAGERGGGHSVEADVDIAAIHGAWC